MEEIGRVESVVLMNDLIEKILSFVPVKSLVRFKCVCKSWNSLMSDPKFIQLHLTQSSQKITDFSHLRLFFICIKKTLPSSKFYFSSFPISSFLQSTNPSSIIREEHDLDNSYYLIGTCNGLISLCGLEYKHNEGHYKHWVCFWNPATRSTSPKSPYVNDAKYRSTVFGFGYDHSSHTYKVVAVNFNCKIPHENQVKVCNMGSNCDWRTIQSFPRIPTIHFDGVHVGGTIHWLALEKAVSNSINWNPSTTIDQLKIVSLHLGNETHSELSLPRGLDQNLVLDKPPILKVLKECLCFCHDHKRTCFMVWQMKEFGVEESWTCVVNVRYEYLHPGLGRIHLQPLPFCMSNNGDILMLSWFRFILYNHGNGRLEHFQTPANIDFSRATNYYIESLVSPS